VLANLKYHATQKGQERKVFIRVARNGDDVYVDMGLRAGYVIWISAKRGAVVSPYRACPVYFRRTAWTGKLHAPFTSPKKGDGSFESNATLVARLWKFVNVGEEDRALVLAWLVWTLTYSRTYPILAVGGSWGSGKSSAARVLKRLIDPGSDDLRSAPKNTRDLVAAARNSYLLAYDNLSNVGEELSDYLCKLATGAAFSERKLYSNYDEALFRASRPLLVNSISDVVTRPDLLSRSLLIETRPIGDEGGTKRMSEEDFWRAFDQDRAYILHALCAAVARGLRDVASVNLDLPRMADFARFCYAALPELGIDPAEFKRALEDNESRGNAIASEASPTIGLILSLVAQRGQWQGTAHDLLMVIKGKLVDGRDFETLKVLPKTPRGMSGLLKD
jgi:hypothetical protein